MTWAHAENSNLKEALSHLPKVPAQPYEKEMAQEIERLRTEVDDLKHKLECEIEDTIIDTMPREMYEHLETELAELKIKYNERGAVMQDTGDVVRSLYAGSEVSKRILAQRDEIERLKAELADAMERLNEILG